MVDVVLKSAPDVARVVKLAFPDYRKRTAWLSAFSSVSINSYWDGGSRQVFALVDMVTGKRMVLPTSSHPYFDVVRQGMAERQNALVEVDKVGNMTLRTLPEGFALVAAGTFCGKPATAHVYVPKENLARLLPE